MAPAVPDEAKPAAWSIFKPATWKAQGKKPKVAHLGEESQMYFHPELKRWVERGKEDEVLQDPGNAPPPVMTLKPVSSVPASGPSGSRRALSNRYVLQHNLSVSSSTSDLAHADLGHSRNPSAGVFPPPPSGMSVSAGGSRAPSGFFMPGPAATDPSKDDAVEDASQDAVTNFQGAQSLPTPGVNFFVPSMPAGTTDMANGSSNGDSMAGMPNGVDLHADSNGAGDDEYNAEAGNGVAEHAKEDAMSQDSDMANNNNNGEPGIIANGDGSAQGHNHTVTHAQGPAATYSVYQDSGMATAQAASGLQYGDYAASGYADAAGVMQHAGYAGEQQWQNGHSYQQNGYTQQDYDQQQVNMQQQPLEYGQYSQEGWTGEQHHAQQQYELSNHDPIEAVHSNAHDQVANGTVSEQAPPAPAHAMQQPAWERHATDNGEIMAPAQGPRKLHEATKGLQSKGRQLLGALAGLVQQAGSFETEEDIAELVYDSAMHPGSTAKLDGPLPWELPDHLKYSDQFLSICTTWHRNNPGKVYNPEMLLPTPEEEPSVAPVDDAVNAAASAVAVHAVQEQYSSYDQQQEYHYAAASMEVALEHPAAVAVSVPTPAMDMYVSSAAACAVSAEMAECQQHLGALPVVAMEDSLAVETLVLPEPQQRVVEEHSVDVHLGGMAQAATATEQLPGAAWEQPGVAAAAAEPDAEASGWGDADFGAAFTLATADVEGSFQGAVQQLPEVQHEPQNPVASWGGVDLGEAVALVEQCVTSDPELSLLPWVEAQQSSAACEQQQQPAECVSVSFGDDSVSFFAEVGGPSEEPESVLPVLEAGLPVEQQGGSSAAEAQLSALTLVGEALQQQQAEESMAGSEAAAVELPAAEEEAHQAAVPEAAAAAPHEVLQAAVDGHEARARQASQVAAYLQQVLMSVRAQQPVPDSTLDYAMSLVLAMESGATETSRNLLASVAAATATPTKGVADMVMATPQRYSGATPFLVNPSPTSDCPDVQQALPGSHFMGASPAHWAGSPSDAAVMQNGAAFDYASQLASLKRELQEDFEQKLAAKSEELEARFEGRLRNMKEELEAEYMRRLAEKDAELDEMRGRCAEMQEDLDQLLLCLGQETRKVTDLSQAMLDAGLDPEAITGPIEEEYAMMDLPE